MTLEGRKWAFKESLVCGIPTIILTWIIMFFTMSKGYAAAPVTLVQAGVSFGGMVTVTSLLCSFLQYPLVGKAFKDQFKEGGKKIPAMGKREEQVIFWRWMPGKWWAYVILVCLFSAALFGTGIPCFIAAWVTPLQSLVFVNRIWHTLLAGIFNGLGTWFAVYLSKIYLVQFFTEKAALAANK